MQFWYFNVIMIVIVSVSVTVSNELTDVAQFRAVQYSSIWQ